MQLYLGRLLNSPLYASDGKTGHIADVYIDEHTWCLTYLEVGISEGAGFDRRLIAAKNVDWSSVALGEAHTRLNCAQIRGGESPDKHPTVGSPHHRENHSERGGLWNWRTIFSLRYGSTLADILKKQRRDSQTVRDNTTGSALRSIRELLGYRVITVTGKAGLLEDLIADIDPGRVFAIVVRRVGWFRRSQALLPAASVSYTSCSHKAVLADFPKEEMVVLRSRPRKDRGH